LRLLAIHQYIIFEFAEIKQGYFMLFFEDFVKIFVFSDTYHKKIVDDEE